MANTPRKRAPAKSAAARQAEAEEGFVTIEQCGIPLRIPIADNTPLDAYMAFKRDDELLGTELLLGPDQWAAFLEKKPTVGDFNAIGRKLEELLGN